MTAGKYHNRYVMTFLTVDCNALLADWRWTNPHYTSYLVILRDGDYGSPLLDWSDEIAPEDWPCYHQSILQMQARHAPVTGI